MDIRKERSELFDEDFNCISNDIQRIFNFCQELTRLTGIYVGNQLGMMYDYLPQVYRSAISI